MKKIILTIAVTATALFAQARGQENYGIQAPHSFSYNPQKIYEALNVKEVQLNPGIVGASRTLKAVANLECTRSLVVVPNAVPNYECTVNDNKKEDFRAIYKALKVKEVQVNPGMVGANRFQKSVGGLICEKSYAVVLKPVAHYTCEFEMQ